LLVNRCPNIFALDRLAEIIVERHIEDVEAGVDSRYHDDAPIEPPVFQFCQHVVTRHSGHMSVQQNDIELPVGNHLEARSPAVDALDVTQTAQSEGVRIGDFLLIVDHKGVW
jgi:hypothetical protein